MSVREREREERDEDMREVEIDGQKDRQRERNQYMRTSRRMHTCAIFLFPCYYAKDSFEFLLDIKLHRSIIRTNTCVCVCLCVCVCVCVCV